MKKHSLLLTTLCATVAFAWPNDNPRYSQVIQDVAGMVSDSDAQRMAGNHGLQLLNVLWEDTGRAEGSSLGPNISDVTLEVVNGEGQHALMPVLRFPNFEDKTSDVRLDKFFIRVGNEKRGEELRTISLKEFLANPQQYMSLNGPGRIRGSLLSNRDSHALVSAQATFLPVPKQGQAKFYPVIFNYQSTAGHPAVLTLLVTRQGTSMTIIDNARDTVSGGSSWGQRLFFNSEGARAPLIAERLSDVKEKGYTANGESADSLGEDSNLLMLVQIPLKIYRPPFRPEPQFYKDGLSGGCGNCGAKVAKKAEAQSDTMQTAPSAAASMGGFRAQVPDMETAVLGHGSLEGKYTELAGLTIERDEQFPVRVTVQFYQATSNSNIGDYNYQKLAAQIKRVYEKGDYVGSLVVPEPRNIGRPTQWFGNSQTSSNLSWWNFPGLVERHYKYGYHAPVQPDPVGIR